MARMGAAALAVLLLAAGGFAQFSVEADLNGVVGDPQPDFLVTAVGDTFTADLWIFGPYGSGCWVFEIFSCDPDGALTLESTQFFSPPGGCWAFLPVGGSDSAGCIRLQGQTICDWPIMFPYKIARVAYRAAVDHSIAELVLGPGSGLLTLTFATHSFDNNGEVIARIQIGDVTEAEPTSWGSVKQLFR